MSTTEKNALSLCFKVRPLSLHGHNQGAVPSCLTCFSLLTETAVWNCYFTKFQTLTDTFRNKFEPPVKPLSCVRDPHFFLWAEGHNTLWKHTKYRMTCFFFLPWGTFCPLGGAYFSVCETQQGNTSTNTDKQSSYLLNAINTRGFMSALAQRPDEKQTSATTFSEINWRLDRRESSTSAWTWGWENIL